MAARKTTTAAAKTNELRGEFEVTIDGKKMVGISSMNALRMFTKSNGYKLDDLGEHMEMDPMGTIAELAYYSCLNKAHREDKDLAMTKEKFVSFFLDSIDHMQEVSEVIMTSLSPQSSQSEPKK